MHSRIVEITIGKLAPENWVNDCTFDSEHNAWFFCFADYVADIAESDYAAEYKDLAERCVIFEINDNSLKLREGGKEKHFKHRLEMLKRRVRKLDLNQFISSDLYGIKELLEDTLDYYVLFDGKLITMDRFIRVMSPETTYFIGGILDYHY